MPERWAPSLNRVLVGDFLHFMIVPLAAMCCVESFNRCQFPFGVKGFTLKRKGLCHAILVSLSRYLSILSRYFEKAARHLRISGMVQTAFVCQRLKADLHGTTLSYAICLRQVYDMNRFV